MTLPEGRAVSDAQEILLAFDFGLKRIGIASGNFLTRTASPVTTLNARSTILWKDIDRLLDEWRPKILVVGLPSGDGERAIAKQVNAFVAALQARYGVAVVTVDEALTSHAAQSELKEVRRSGYLRRRVGKGRIDTHAACLIAEQWMSETA